MLAERDVSTLTSAYREVNRSFGRAFVFRLTGRGFFSEVTNLITAMVFGLAEKRRILVEQSAFNGFVWADFNQSSSRGLKVRTRQSR